MSSDIASLAVIAEPGVTITVADRHLRRVARGIAELNAQLPTGLYELQFTAGHSIDSVVVRLPAEGLTHRAEPMAFVSPAPRPQTDPVWSLETIHETSLSPNYRIGAGAELLVAIRDAEAVPGQLLTDGLSLVTENGETLAYGDELARQFGDAHRGLWAAFALEADPGVCRLRTVIGAMTVEQTVVLVEGWQTQVFLDRRDCGGERGVSLPDAAVAMARMEIGFDPHCEDLRLAELARIALLDHRQVLTSRDFESMVYGKWENPMLGLYSFWILLDEHRVERHVPGASHEELGDLVHIMAKNLRGLLGDHPDVAAMDVRLGRRVEPVEHPPMLRASWETLITTSLSFQPDIVAADAPAGLIADRLFGSGVWLSWTTDAEAEAIAAEAVSRRWSRPVDPSDLAGGLQALARLLARGERPEEDGLSPAAQDVLTLARRAARDLAAGVDLAEQLNDITIVQRLGVPRAVAARAVASGLDALGGGPVMAV